MHMKVLQVSCRYLTRVVRYSRNTGGGNIYPPSVARVKKVARMLGKVTADALYCFIGP